jgi:hypothetical protein
LAGATRTCERGTDKAPLLDQALLDRIDAIVPPGVNINPADGGWQSPALETAARRREVLDPIGQAELQIAGLLVAVAGVSARLEI